MVKRVTLRNQEEILFLFGQYDENLKLIENLFGIEFYIRENSLTIKGKSNEVKKVYSFITNLLSKYRKSELGPSENVKDIISNFYKNTNVSSVKETVINEKFGKVVPRTQQQAVYLEAIANNDLVFCIGPAGTGKTYLACGAALAYLKEEKISRIILCRPVVEAGEKLGFLPGDFYEKVDPYLRPLYDAFFSIVGPGMFNRYKQEGLVEIIPLAYMRGRTLDDAFIILDEAQNTTTNQMKMFLTRLGFNSKAVINGDITQIDLEKGVKSGLVESQYVLKGIPGIEFVYLTEQDVVRHPLVKSIVNAYDKYENKEKETESAG